MKLVKRVVTYHEWTVLEGPRALSRYPTGRNKITCKCRCICGTEREVVFKDLKSGISKSCGCAHKYHGGASNPVKKHGMTGTAVYHAWHGLRQRCENANAPNYHRYGGRGIKVCERWQSFDNFYADMGDKPTPMHTVERKNVHGDYTPENCVWATAKEQANNRTTNYKVTYKGKEMTLAQLAETTGINHQTLWNRIVLGKMPVVDAAALPVKTQTKHQKEFTYNGETKTVAEWAKQYGMAMQSLWHRLFLRGWDFERAITTPMQKQDRPKEPERYMYDGHAYSARAFALKFGFSPSIAKRVLKKMTVEAVIEVYATVRP